MGNRRRRFLPARTGQPITAPVTASVSVSLFPQQYAVDRYETEIADRITKLEVRAIELAERYGMPFTRFALNPPIAPNSPGGWELALGIVAALSSRTEQISLERRGDRWGLYFTDVPAPLAVLATPRSDPERLVETTPLSAAPLEIRERFLQRSDDFFSSYRALCDRRLGLMSGAVAQADRTLARLDELFRS